MNKLPEWYGDNAPRFLHLYPEYKDAEKARGQCYEASLNFARHSIVGDQISLYRLDGYKGDVNQYAYTKWRVPPYQWSHTIIQVNGTFQDWTPHQFDPRMQPGVCMTLETISTLWCDINLHPMEPIRQRYETVVNKMHNSGRGVVVQNVRHDEQFYVGGYKDIDHEAVLEWLANTGFSYEYKLLYKNMGLFIFESDYECSLFKMTFGIVDNQKWWEQVADAIFLHGVGHEEKLVSWKNKRKKF